MGLDQHWAQITADWLDSAVDEVRRAEWNAAGKSTSRGGCWVKSVKWSLLKALERQTAEQLTALHEVQRANKRLYCAVLLKEELRLLYHLEDRSLADAHLKAWLAWTSRSKLKPFVKLARTIRRYRTGILAAIRLGLSNGRMEALNSKVRLLSHRSFRLPRPRASHRPHLPVLHRPHNWAAAAMTSTGTTGAPYKDP
jgi:transposase